MRKFVVQKTTLALIFFLGSLCVPCIARPAEGAVSEIPFTFENGYVIVQAKIKRLPVELILSTGAEHSGFSGAMIEKHKLQLGYTGDDPQNCNMADCTYTFSNVSEIAIGDLKPVNLTMRLETLNEIRKRLGREVFGRLGADFFKGRIVQFDFAKKVVRFLPQSLELNGGTNVTVERTVVKMTFYRENISLPVVEEVSFDGKKVKTVIDTGAATVVALSPSALKQMGRAAPADKGATRVDKVATLKIGDYAISDVPVLLYAKGAGFDRDLKEFGAIAGTGLLQNFLVTFDYRSKVIIFEHL